MTIDDDESRVATFNHKKNARGETFSKTNF